MSLTWALLIISFGLFFTKAGYLGTPYRVATIFYLVMHDRLGAVEWYNFVAVFCTVDYLCARFYMNRTNEFSNILKWLLLSGVVVNFFLGVDLAFNTNTVYDNWERIIQGLNILQIITLMAGGYSAGLADRRWYLDKYSGIVARKELMVALVRSSSARLFANLEGKA